MLGRVGGQFELLPEATSPPEGGSHIHTDYKFSRFVKSSREKLIRKGEGQPQLTVVSDRYGKKLSADIDLIGARLAPRMRTAPFVFCDGA